MTDIDHENTSEIEEIPTKKVTLKITCDSCEGRFEIEVESIKSDAIPLLVPVGLGSIQRKCGVVLFEG